MLPRRWRSFRSAPILFRAASLQNYPTSIPHLRNVVRATQALRTHDRRREPNERRGLNTQIA